MSGPYFEGQQPSPCGHYYPDVLRLRDEKRPDGTFVRILHCTQCGEREFPLDPETLDPSLVKKLNRKGVVAGVREEKLAGVRRKELKRLSSRRR